MDYQLQSVKDLSIEKGKKGVQHIIFGRVGILIVCLVIQLLLLFVGMTYLAQYIYWFFGGYLAFGFLILLIIVNRTMNPGIQLSWAVIVLLFPIFGGLLYLYVEIQPGTHMLKASLADMDDRTAGMLLQDQDVIENLASKSENTAQLASYIYREESFPIYRNTGVKYFPSGEAKFAELLNQLRLAEHFIFMEYFIVHPGYMWDAVFELLKAKVKEGVEVRFLYDGMNELSNVPGKFQDMLRGEGIQCKVFSPVYPIISTHYNNRDHRKIVVIDGHTAFTGGVNIADEYINRKERFGHWKDAAVMVQGDAVSSFTLMFLKMWDVAGKTEDMKPYLTPMKAASHTMAEDQDTIQHEDREMSPQEEHETAADDKMSQADDMRNFGGQTAIMENQGFVMPFGTNPFHSEHIAKRVYLDILNHAKRYVYIMTPYLVPDYELLQALTYAARRRVDVKIIMPHIPDKKYAFALAHSYYRYLLQAGVRIYEYSPGFVHSKIFVSDDRQAVVGAINLDYRSLYLNFESAVYLYDVPAVYDVKADVLQTLTRCQLMTDYDIRHDKITRKMVGAVLKLIAPLL